MRLDATDNPLNARPTDRLYYAPRFTHHFKPA
jgi:hypothetical protein